MIYTFLVITFVVQKMFRSSRRTITIQVNSEVRDGRLKALEWAKKNLAGFGPPARKILTPEEVAASRARAYAWAEQNGLISSAPEYNRDEDESAGDDVPRRRTGFGPPIPSAPGPFGTPIPSAPFVAPDDRDEDESAGDDVPRRRTGFGPPIPSAPGPFGANFRGRAGSWSSEF
jgi:hypothetical protein